MSNGKRVSSSTKIIALILAILALTAVMAVIASNRNKNIPTNTDGEQSSVFENNETDEPETTAPETEKETEPETTAPETEPPAPPKYYNPLTGIECSEEISKQRPVGIMINNIQAAIPQEGITYGDVIYECLAEGGITRLFMLIQDYANVPKAGSVRSARDYYLDFAQNHNALFFHAGGSDKAYSEIASRKIDNFDGVRMSIPNSFYRDPWRKQNMALEHTMVITGEGMVNAIKYRNATTELKEDFVNPFNFSQEKITLEGNDANCVYLPFSYYQAPYLKYNAASDTYLRWQYKKPHADKEGNQLQFSNILVIFCHHTGALDNKGRIEVTTTGEGEGYYINGGKYIDIKYSKAGVDAPIVLTNTDGTPLVMNTGKTYVAIFNSANKANINMNYDK
jgi:hypothetical protein